MKGLTFDLQRFSDAVTAENAVAQIGNNYYATLQEAVNDVQDDGTITLLKKASGDGVKVESGKNFTLDFGGYTYDVNGKLVGSTGTETQAFQLLQNSTIKFRNGTITSSVAKMLVQNYSNLTLDNMTLDGSNLQVSDPYTLSNNNGNVTIKDTTINAKSDGFAFDVCVYASYPKVNVTVTGNSVINGNVEMSKSGSRNYSDATLTISGGTFNGELSIPSDAIGDGKANITISSGQFKVANETLGITAEVVDTEGSYFTTETLADAIKGVTKITIDGTTKYYTTQELAAAATKNCIAKIDGTTSYYTTLQAAVNDVESDGTITLLKDATGGGIATYTDFSKHPRYAQAKNFTIDFGGHIYTIGSSTVGSTGYETQAFHLEAGSDTSNPVSVTFKNGTITSSVAKMLVQNYSNLTLKNMTLDGSKLVDDPPYTLSNNNGTVNITNSTITAKDGGYAFDLYVFQSYPKVNVTVENSTINGKVELARSSKATHEGYSTLSLTINSGTFNGDLTGEADALKQVTINGGTFANSAIKAGATLLVVDNVLVAAGWNKTADGFFYVAAPESGIVGTKLITVSGIDSTDEIKFDAEHKVFAVPTSATATVNDDDYKLVKVSYADDAATVKTDEDAIEITENLLAGTVTKISAAGNAKTVYISGGDKVNSIVGGAKNDTLGGANADITLTGGQGADIFIYDSGELTITDYGTGSDKISVGADAGNPKVTASGSDLVLDFGEGNTVNLLNAADKTVALTNGTDTSYFMKDGQTSANGDSITLAASTTKYTVQAPIKNVDGSKTSGVTITGNALDNVLTGGAGNDKFTGGKGDDIFVQGAGNDTITDYGTGADKISVDAAPTSFAFRGSNLRLDFDNNKTLAFNSAKGKAITFTDGKGSTVRTYFENGAFAEGDKVTINENFKGSRHNISKADDLKQIDASQATVKVNLTGNDEGNTLTGGKGNDTLTGGKGDDLLTGGNGSDIFVYAGGADTVTDYATEDTVKVNKGNTIQSAAFGTDVVFTFGDDKTLTLTDAGDDTITVKDASNKIWAYNKTFTAQGKGVTLASSATEFDATDTAFVTLDGSAASAVKLTGNEKNNVFVGTEGADTFIHTAGKDIITNYDSTDKVQVADFGEITAAKFNATKTVLTVGKGAITFNDALTKINLVDAEDNSATVTKAGLVTGDEIQLFKGTKIYDGNASIVDATNVKNKLTLAGGAAAQTFTGAAGRTVYTFDGTGTMTIENYAAGDKISVNGSVTNFAVEGDDITLTVTNDDKTGSIVLQGAADKVITLHDDSDKAGKYTAHSYPQTGVTANVGTYSAPSTVNKITYTGGNVTAKSLAFGTAGTLTIGDLANNAAVQLAHTNDKGKTVYLGSHMLSDAAGENVSVTSDKYTAGDKVKTVAALGTQKSYLTGNALANTLTANDAGNTLDGSAGTDVLIGGGGKDIFIHDKIAGTTTINGYTFDDDKIKLGNGLTIVGSAYSPGSKSGTLTLTVEGVGDQSKIVIKSDDFNDTASPIYGTIVIDDTQTSFAKNATYADDKVKLLPTFSGTFNATASSQVDGSAVTKALTLNGTTGNETLTGGAYKTTLNGSAGDDSLIGGAGTDVFTYAAGDGNDVIANFAYNTDKLQVSTTELIGGISQSDGKLKFTMTDGGSVTIEDMQTNILLKADNTLYWFDGGKLVTAGDDATQKELSAIVKAPTDYAIVQLDYGTNLVTAELATASDQSTAFNADTFKKKT